jgi:hypothetical protein
MIQGLNLRAGQQVPKLQGLDQVGVPDHAAVLNTDLWECLVNLVDSLNTLIQRLLSTENGDISLHNLLHRSSDIVGAPWSVRSTDLVQESNRVGTSISADLLVGHAGLEVVTDSVGNGTTEDDKIQKGVGSETVGTVDGHTGGFTTGEKTGNNLVLASLVDGKNLTSVLGWDTTHIVVDGRENWDR